jgi:uridine kinase
VNPTVCLVAIAGGSGAGKSWLARKLQRRLPGLCARVSLDDFYRDLGALPEARRARHNFDDPSAVDWPLFRQLCAELRAGKGARLPVYDFRTHTRSERSRSLRVRPIILLEGLWPYHTRALRALYDLRLFVDCSEELRFARRLERDIRERRRSQLSVQRQWRQQVRPMHRRHVEPQRRWAHLVLRSPLGPDDLNEVLRALRGLRTASGRPAGSLAGPT